MAHYLDANDLTEACAALGLHGEEATLIEAAQRAGEAIAKKLGIALTIDAESVPGMGGLCVGFGPAFDGQLCPDAILPMDDCSDWHDETEARSK